MTLRDLLKRCSEEDMDKVLVWHDIVGWSNVEIKIKECTIDLYPDFDRPFVLGGKEEC